MEEEKKQTMENMTRRDFFKSMLGFLGRPNESPKDTEQDKRLDKHDLQIANLGENDVALLDGVVRVGQVLDHNSVIFDFRLNRLEEMMPGTQIYRPEEMVQSASVQKTVFDLKEGARKM